MGRRGGHDQTDTTSASRHNTRPLSTAPHATAPPLRPCPCAPPDPPHLRPRMSSSPPPRVMTSINHIHIKINHLPPHGRTPSTVLLPLPLPLSSFISLQTLSLALAHSLFLFSPNWLAAPSLRGPLPTPFCLYLPHTHPPLPTLPSLTAVNNNTNKWPLMPMVSLSPNMKTTIMWTFAYKLD